MNRETFVDAVRLNVRDATVTGMISVLSRAPGRKPDQNLLDLSAWFKELSIQDREKLESVIKMTAHAAVFGFLCVLDGVRPIEDGPESATLALRYQRGIEDLSLNDAAAEMLHDLL